MESLTIAQQLIGDIRARSGLTQAELARRAGVPRSVVNAYERGKREPGTESLARLAESAGFRLELSPSLRSVDRERAGRILGEVLDLAESLPARRRGKLEFPPLRRRTR
ncbi:MAG TPA: helix-turn-helix transcriptional regulator [Solirubrobacteraceae bacterium]|nr:helix-turn-helix transcriptional regulator [Solirubrobacteraceae bacterium]